MCIQVTERYAVCGCVYYTHAVDPCPKAGSKGHQVQKRNIKVGYICSVHNKSGTTASGSGTNNGGSKGTASGNTQSSNTSAKEAAYAPYRPSPPAASNDSGYGSHLSCISIPFVGRRHQCPWSAFLASICKICPCIADFVMQSATCRMSGRVLCYRNATRNEHMINGMFGFLFSRSFSLEAWERCFGSWWNGNECIWPATMIQWGLSLQTSRVLSRWMLNLERYKTNYMPWPRSFQPSWSLATGPCRLAFPPSILVT